MRATSLTSPSAPPKHTARSAPYGKLAIGCHLPHGVSSHFFATRGPKYSAKALAKSRTPFLTQRCGTTSPSTERTARPIGYSVDAVEEGQILTLPDEANVFICRSAEFLRLNTSERGEAVAAVLFSGP